MCVYEDEGSLQTEQIRGAESSEPFHSFQEIVNFCQLEYGGSNGAGHNMEIWMGFANWSCEPSQPENPNLYV